MPTVRGHIEAITLNGSDLSPALYAQQCGRAKRPGPRHLVREEVIEFDEAPYYIDRGVAVELPGPMQRVTVWRFHYSDGDVEQITNRRGAHATA